MKKNVKKKTKIKTVYVVYHDDGDGTMEVAFILEASNIKDANKAAYDILYPEHYRNYFGLTRKGALDNFMVRRVKCLAV